MPLSGFPPEWTRLIEIAQRIEEIVQRFEDGVSPAELVQDLMEARAELQAQHILERVRSAIGYASGEGRDE